MTLLVAFFLLLCTGQASCQWGDEFVSPCGDPPSIDGAYISEQAFESNGREDVETATYACLNGAKPTGQATITCRSSTKRWSSPLPKCGSVEATKITPAPTQAQDSWDWAGYEDDEATTTPERPVIGPRNGPKCRYGLRYPHSLCLNDSASLLRIEQPTSNGKDEILARHNFWRRSRNLNPPPRNPLPQLQWDDDLALTAERWAAQCNEDHDLAEDRGLPDRGDRGAEWPQVGQNICYASGPYFNWSQCIDSFADERHDWRWGVGPARRGAMVGHYTQMVWETTTFVGCGRVRCRGKWQQILVCNYAEAGNAIGEDESNPYAKPYRRAD